MAEKTTYEQKGTLREECMKDTATLDGFRPLEDDWRELLRWLVSVSGDLPYYDRTDKENGKLSSLWENHVLTVLVDILRKDVCGYVDSFVDGRGTSAQTAYTDDLKDKFTGWARRLEEYIRRSRGRRTDSPAIGVAEALLSQIEDAMPQEENDRDMYFSPLMDTTNRPYYRMLGTVEDIQRKAGEYIDRIEQGSDMDASLALLLTFVRNYCGIISRFNKRFSGWADFYRRNILHDTPKPPVQDSTYIIVEPDREKKAETFALPEGTKFIAGTKADGTELYYATTEKTYIVPAHIHTAYALFRKDGRLHTSPLPDGKQENSTPLFNADTPDAVPLEYGWLIASRSLVLAEGTRTVTVSFRLDTEGNNPPPSLSLFTGDAKSFILQVSGSEGWITKEYTLNSDNCSLAFGINLKEDGEAPAVCTEKVHGITTGYPALRILFADRKLPDTLPQELYMKKIRIHTRVEGIRNFTLRGESGDMDPSQPFYPFGPLGEHDSRLIFGHEEASLKHTLSVSLKGAWSKLPEGGFKPIYSHYETARPIDDDSFRVRCEWQEENRWQECESSPLPLFSKNGDGRLSEDAAFEFLLTEKSLTRGMMPYRRDRKGFYRLILSEPAIGFGTDTYYQQFAEVMMHNSREKEKNRKPVPSQPQVPMLSDVTFGYEAEEELSPENGDRLYLLNGTGEYEECTDYEKNAPAFLPDTDAPSLLVGLDNPGDTNRLRFYFNLHYAMKDGVPASEQGAVTLHISRYAGNGIWQEFAQEDMLCEETEGMTRNGFVEVKIKRDGPEENRWLRFSFVGGKAPKSTIADGIYLNCFRVTAGNGDGYPLPAGTIAAPAVEDSRLLSVYQPLPGSGGKPAGTEADAGVRRRIRISGRNRAVCGGNYEELLLERFPEVEKVCCLPATTGQNGVCIAVFPKPEKRKYLFLPGWKLAEMQAYLRQYAPPFADMQVVNPVYQPLKIHFKAVLKKDAHDPGSVKRRTERRIRVFFMTWYMDGMLPDLGVCYSGDALLARIVNDEYIEEFVSLEITGNGHTWKTVGADGKWEKDDDRIAATDNCGVLYIGELCVELADHRDGVEEARLGMDFRIG